MNEIITIASRVSTPLALGGVVAAFLFLIFRQIISRNIFPKLTAALSGTIFHSIINKLFVLALVAMILGFIGFVLPFLRQEAPISVSINLPAGTSLRNAAKMIAGNEGYTLRFLNCDEATLNSKVEPGQSTGKTAKELIEALQYRVIDVPSPKKYRVEVLKDGGIYEIRCD